MNTQQRVASPHESQQSRAIRWVLGVGLPLVAGSTLWWIPALMGYSDIMDDPTTGYIVLGITIVFVFAGAAVLRSWWALLVAPAAWLVGEALASLVSSLSAGSVNWLALLPLSGGLLLYVGLPVLISAALGAFFGLWLARRRTARETSQTPISR